MSKRSRQHRPTPNKPVRIVLTAREFKDFQGACAVAALNVQAIQQDAAQRIAAAQQAQQKELAKLAKKYRAQGMRADVNYAFDEQTHSLVSVRE
ncbi:MAG: hypothetical protein NUV51_09250 [Sulfuricaulis sp.]|nr:hypothetical protein [Sulfuricaulis sp.]